MHADYLTLGKQILIDVNDGFSATFLRRIAISDVASLLSAHFSRLIYKRRHRTQVSMRQ